MKQDLLYKKQFLKILWSVVWKGGFQLIQILGLLGVYFDAVVIEVKTFLLLFRLARAILWLILIPYWSEIKRYISLQWAAAENTEKCWSELPAKPSCPQLAMNSAAFNRCSLLLIWDMCLCSAENESAKFGYYRKIYCNPQEVRGGLATQPSTREREPLLVPYWTRSLPAKGPVDGQPWIAEHSTVACSLLIWCMSLCSAEGVVCLVWKSTVRGF